MPHLKLLNDLAINEGSNTRIDGLGFETYAQVLGDAAIGTPGPFTIGVFGEWGTGKTSLMHLTEEYVKHQANGNVITVWFNAWRYEKEEHPIVPLLATIIKELKANQAFTENLSDKGREFITALRAVAYGFSAKSKIKMSGLAEIEASFVAKEMIDRAENLSNDPLLDKSIYYEAFERLSKITIDGNKKIVVFIDDLDRCFPDLAIQLLESIKLVLCQSGFIFVLGVARTVIEGYLQHRYQKEYGIEDFRGESYLDKIVQLPFYIPPHNERLESFCSSIIKQLEANDKNVFKSILPTIAATTGGNPRATIRFLNNLLIDRAINSLMAVPESIVQIPIEYFGITRLIQQQWNDVFLFINDFPKIAEEASKWGIDDLQKIANADNGNASYLAKRMYSNKLLSDLLYTKQGKDWLRNSRIRKSTVAFIMQRTHEKIVEDLKILILSDEHDIKFQDLIVEYLLQQKIVDYVGIDRWTKKGIFTPNIMDYSLVIICIGKRFAPLEHAIDEVVFISEKNQKTQILPVIIPGGDPLSMPKSLIGKMFVDIRDDILLTDFSPLLKYINRLKKTNSIT